MQEDAKAEETPSEIREEDGGSKTAEDPESLRAVLETKTKELEDSKDKYLRANAEFENAKRRLKKDQDEAIRYANENLIRELLTVLDNLERAIVHADDSKEPKPLIEGVELTCKQFGEILQRFGVTPIASVGTKFDPAVHQAMVRVESPSHDENTVVEEFQRGYRIKDRVLRPSMVSVAVPRRNGGGDDDTLD